MASYVFPIINALTTLGNVASGIGFGTVEKKKMALLKSETEKLKDTIKTSKELYINCYYEVAINLQRLANAIDTIPDGIVNVLENNLSQIRAGIEVKGSLDTLRKAFGVAEKTSKSISKMISVVRNAHEYDTLDDGDPWKGTKFEGRKGQLATARANRIVLGIDFAGAVFAIGGLGFTIGLGVWTLQKLDQAIAEVKKKQTEAAQFLKGMTKVINSITKDAGLQPNDYAGLKKLAETWKETSIKIGYYEKLMWLAIQGFVRSDATLEKVKESVKRGQGGSAEPFPENGYKVAKGLADEIKLKIKEGLTDPQIVSYMSKHPTKERKFKPLEYMVYVVRKIISGSTRY